MMKWDEIKRRLKNGASVQIIADLDGVPYKTMYNRIKWHERQDGIKYMPEEKKRKPKQKDAPKVVPDPAPGKTVEIPEVVPVIVTNDYSCKGCAHCMQASIGLFCEMGHECGAHCVCSDYKTFPEPAPAPDPEFLQKKMNLPEVVQDPVPKPARELMPETIDEMLQTYRQVRELADRYQKQAEDWRFILCSLGVNIPEGDGNG